VVLGRILPEHRWPLITLLTSLPDDPTDQETPTQAWILLCVSMALALFHIPVCVGAYRISRDTSMFIGSECFFSESLTNAILLVSSVVASQLLLIGKEAWAAWRRTPSSRL